MARGKQNSTKLVLNKKRSHGKHAKSASTNKTSKKYKKVYVGQG